MSAQLIGDMAIKDLSPKDSNIGGRLVKNLRICGSGIYTYGISEAPLLGLDPVPEEYKDFATINVYRPPEVLKANKDKFARIPIITGHHVRVDTTNAKQLAVGMVGDSVTDEVGEDGETYLYTTGTIIAGDGVEAYEKYGQLSVGYIPTMTWQKGNHNGTDYQAVLTGFECVNHLLICKVARGGPQCMVMDSLDDTSLLEKFILKHAGGEDMSIFNKIFGSAKKEIAGDSAIVSAHLQAISAGANPKVQVKKIRDMLGDSIDKTFDEYLGELEVAGDEKPEVVAKAVNIVDDYYREKCVGDEAKEEPKAEAKEEPKAEAKEEPKAEAKEEPKAEAKEEPKAEAKEEPKAEAKEEPKKDVPGDSIDYEKLASLVASKLQPKVEEPKVEVGGDELSMPMGGDTIPSSKSSDDFMSEIFGGI